LAQAEGGFSLAQVRLEFLRACPVQPKGLRLALSPSAKAALHTTKEPVMAKKSKTKDLKNEIKKRKAKIEGHLDKMKKALKALKKG
jgi:hypothetical protein